MSDIERASGTAREDGASPADDLQNLKTCCVETIRMHALYNPMMVCTECKQIIKCFPDERAYRNYVTFCNSRRRKVQLGRVDGYYTVVFQTYDNYR